MTEAQIQLQNALTTTFLANLAFLSEYDNELYHRVDELSQMIEKGTYKEKYKLDFIEASGDFDVYDVMNDKYLYDKNPKRINNTLIEKVQFDEKIAILDIPQHFTFRNVEKINRDTRFDLEDLSELNSLTLNDCAEYTNVLDDFLESKVKKLKKIDKFIFLGTLLGRHIPKIAKKINAKAYLVLERNLEIFRLSLFTVDYTILANNGVIFSIMDNLRNEEFKIYRFLNICNLENYLLKLSVTNINIDKYVDNLLSILHTLNATGYDYNRKLYTFVNRASKVLSSNYNTLCFNSIRNNCNIFNSTIILYLAAGPSLDENLEWIKENQDKFFIVTIGAAYKKLLDNDIRIDLITTLDEQYEILNNKQFDNKTVSRISDNTIIFASSITNKKILKKFNQSNLFIYEVFRSFQNDGIAFDGFSIGEITLAMLLHLNPKEIYLIGLDFALNQDTGDSHSKNSNSGLSKLDLAVEQNREIFNHRSSLLKVKGNLKEEVFTTPLFYTSIKSTESKIVNKDKNLKIYNLSNHGAYLHNTIPINIKELKPKKLNDSVININNFRTLLIENSIHELNKESKDLLKKEILFIKNDINILMLDIKDSTFKDYDEFYNKIKILPTKLFENKSIITYQLLTNYFQIVMPYLFYNFNDKKIKKEKSKIKEVKKIFVKQIENILNDYIFCLEKLLKKAKLK